MNGLAALVLALALALGAEACDRCAGMVGCAETPRLSLDGELIVRTTGAAVSGAEVSFVRSGGVPLASDSISTTSTGNGQFQLAVNATAVGEVVGDIVVRPPAPWLPYRVSSLAFHTSDVRGQGQILGRWVVDPYISYYGPFVRRSDGVPLAGAHVTIIRTGGVAVSPDTLAVTAGSDGAIYFEIRAAAAGDMLADVLVDAPDLATHSRLSDVAFTAQYLDLMAHLSLPISVGPGLKYVGEVRRTDTSGPMEGATIEFQRTGGIEVTPSLMVTVSHYDGRFPFTLSTLDSGEVIGDLTIRPPAPFADLVITGLRLQTFESDVQRLAGVWSLTPPGAAHRAAARPSGAPPPP